MTPLEQLEKWSHGHKARSVRVESPDSYGAGCWEVWLGHEHGVTMASEAQFWSYSEERGGESGYRADVEKLGQVFPTEEQMDAGLDGWAGLECTITCALRAFDRGVWGPRKTTFPLPDAQPIRAAVDRLVQAERAAVVAWLRAEANEPHPIEAGERALSPSGRGLLLLAASRIESGEHRREETK